jgi:hypothetical protein
MPLYRPEWLDEVMDEIISAIKEKNKKIEILNNKIEEAKKYILENFANQDGTIWHGDMKDIYNILIKESD